MKTLLTILSVVMAFTSCATTSYVLKSDDGVNTITTTVDDNGYVMGSCCTMAYVPERHIVSESNAVENTCVLAGINKGTSRHLSNGSVKKRTYVSRTELTENQRRWMFIYECEVQNKKTLQEIMSYLQALEKRVRALEQNSNVCYPIVMPNKEENEVPK